MYDAMLLSETGWSPDILDNTSEQRIQSFLLFKNVKHVVENGGELF